MTAEAEKENADIAALAKGGKTNVFGFVLRLAARIPFLFIAGQLYGATALGRFAYALLVVELVGQLATLGLRRGLAESLSKEDRPPAHCVADGLLVAWTASAIGAAILISFPQLMFPNSEINGLDRFLPLIIFASVAIEISLAACAYRFDVGAAVRARAVIEPWTLSLAAAGFYFIWPRDGLILAYVASLVACLLASFIPMLGHYGLPWGWKPHGGQLFALARRNMPLAAADAAEWGSRRLDLAILGLFASPAVVGVYYVAQQIASLPQKLRTTFDPILGPVITRNVQAKNWAEIAKQVSQVGFWIIAAQAGVALALGIPGDAIMRLVGKDFSGGTGAASFLLAAEVAAAMAVVSEAALIYVARGRNLAVSLGMLALQATLSVGFIFLVDHIPLKPDRVGYYQAAAVAAALMISLGVGSYIKSEMLQRILGSPIRIIRPVLIWAVAAATILGLGATQLPEWLELAIGVPAILGLYCFVIWTRGFTEEDRALFRKTQEPAEEPEGPTPPPKRLR